MNFKLSHQRGVFPSKNMTVSRDFCSCILKRFLSVANENKIMIASPALCKKKTYQNPNDYSCQHHSQDGEHEYWPIVEDR